MKSNLMRFVIILLLAVVSACAPQPERVESEKTATATAPSVTTPLTGLKFVLMNGTLQGKPIEVGQTGITLEFTGEGKAVGKAPCNQYFGRYQAAENGDFKIENLGATLKSCSAKDLEDDYLAALGLTRRFELDAQGGLVLSSPDKTTTLTFQLAASLVTAAETDGLAAGNYTLARLVLQGQAVELPADQDVTFTIETGGRFSGKSVCNNYFGRLEFGTGDALSLNGVGATKMMCPENMQIENAYFEALARVTRFQIDEGESLILQSDDGTTEIVMQNSR